MAASVPAGSSRIFISYRREDTAYPAGWLFDRLADRFGHDQVFKDVDSIQPGDDLAEVIAQSVGSCDVLLAVIGSRWLASADEAGQRRVDDPADFVRLEIEAALTRDVRVIPVLIDGTRMPLAGELPASLAGLTRRQALELSAGRFDAEAKQLIEFLDQALAEVHAGEIPDDAAPAGQAGPDPATPPASAPMSASAPMAGPGGGHGPGRKHRRCAAVAAVAVLVLLGAAGGLIATLYSPPAVRPGGTSPMTQVPGALSGVLATSTTRAWAVGESCEPESGCPGPSARALILRWNGTAWSKMSTSGHGIDSVLGGTATGPAGTAWAVGGYCTSGCGTSSETDQTLILHWDGAAWSRVPSPSPGRSAGLDSVSTEPDGTAWAVGGYCPSVCHTSALPDKTLILRWNGTAWSRVPSPSPGLSAGLLSISAAPGGTVWAAGYYGNSAGYPKTLTVRWNGTAWSRVPSPSPGLGAFLLAISAAPDGTAWAVDTYCPSGCGTSSEIDRTLILHWNGAAWSQVPSPSPGREAGLEAVITEPDGTAWAVGSYCVSRCRVSSERTLILHWNGTAAWSQVPSPDPGRGADLLAVSAGPGATAWAAGWYCTSGCGVPYGQGGAKTEKTLILRWNGTTWSVG